MDIRQACNSKITIEILTKYKDKINPYNVYMITPHAHLQKSTKILPLRLQSFKTQSSFRKNPNQKIPLTSLRLGHILALPRTLLPSRVREPSIPASHTPLKHNQGTGTNKTRNRTGWNMQNEKKDKKFSQGRRNRTHPLSAHIPHGFRTYCTGAFQELNNPESHKDLRH